MNETQMRYMRGRVGHRHEGRDIRLPSLRKMATTVISAHRALSGAVILLCDAALAVLFTQLAYAERGYNAAGGEWLLTAFVAGASIYLYAKAARKED